MRLIAGIALLLAADFSTSVNAVNEALIGRIDPYSCAKRTVHDIFNDHGYLFTWEDPKTVHLELNWSEAREFCRARCMELVGLETKAENEFVKQHIDKGHVRFAWTGGRKCNFAGCDRADLKPISIYGWFWTGSLQKMPPTTNRLDTDWSDSGGIGRPQPDNREYIQGGAEEECVAILNNFYDDGIRWHDVSCHHRKPFICEDNDALLQAAHIPNKDQQYQVPDTYTQYQTSSTTKKINLEEEPQPPQHDDRNLGPSAGEGNTDQEQLILN
ncbi:uncharacterized protein [Periplaneta americana]|uniref:uncharacterized protein n=1 Tax=Periplaneta americana TaxID=6978 RepID=UPI0037E90066